MQEERPSFYSGMGRKEYWPDITGAPPMSLTYADVALVPQNSDIESRRNVDTSVDFGPYRLRLPLIAAPMDTVSGSRMIRALHELGAIGTLPRGTDFAKDLKICEELSKEGVPCVYAVGLARAFDHAKEFKERGAEMVLIDVAHGGMQNLKEAAKDIRERLNLSVVVGNIANYLQAGSFLNYGIEIARVGVGPGAVCKTREVTGVGTPQLSAIFDTVSSGIYVIADGGIQYPGDVPKALAAGANMVMIGSLFAGADEAPGDVLDGTKVFRGQASGEYMRERNNHADYKAEEGISILVKRTGPIRNTVLEIAGGLRSAMSYSGARTIEEFQEKAMFQLTSLSAQIEGKPHAIFKG